MFHKEIDVFIISSNITITGCIRPRVLVEGIRRR